MSIRRADLASFRDLLERLSVAWAALDAVGAADCFTADATYMEPPAEQLFRGRAELVAYFSALEPGTYFDLHEVWFAAPEQVGAVEFSFGVRGRDTADHGVAIVELEHGLVRSWREYVTPGPADMARFRATDGKAWRWHAGNYP